MNWEYTPMSVNVSFQTVKLNGVSEEYKLVLVNKRMFELIQEGESYTEARNIFLSEWEGPPAPEWTSEDMV